eukprot:CAMPEP_0184690836 /NCGR_PEP_ID=MMETSP0312-20130426/31462_1 /TAXON_ID=31354 /ORGANISM="Compsopogon coeruleus, Strain SAG 36.94" /LENGTH=322 /DNA_ID=CAMNT_0027148399 /DNA_START=272 /DNA_END=1240 /DNA_ORIENTATION=-
MRAVVQKGTGSKTEDVLCIVDLPIPEPRDDEVLIRVCAAGLNAIDGFRMQGVYGGSPETVPIGYDVSGVVEKCGRHATRFQPGDRVYGDVVANSIGPKVAGSLAEYCAVEQRLLAKIPEGLTFVGAAALPVAVETSVLALQALKIEPGQKIIVTGGAGGVAGHCIQIAKAPSLPFRAGEVVSSASTSKVQAVMKLGANRVVDYKSCPLGEALEPTSFDRILDTTGEFRSLKPLLKDPDAVDKLVSIHGSAFAAPPGEVSPMSVVPDGALLDFIRPALEAGHIIPFIDRFFAFESFVDAVDYAIHGRPTGKVVVSVEAPVHTE